jgi:hypothetical protein
MSSDNPCTLTLPDGTHYDLSPLSSSSADYVSQVGDVSYKLNVCRAVVSELWKMIRRTSRGSSVVLEGISRSGEWAQRTADRGRTRYTYAGREVRWTPDAPRGEAKVDFGAGHIETNTP